MVEHIGYWRVLINRGSVYKEFVNGCPTLLSESEPAFVVIRNTVGQLVAYYHWKSEGARYGKEN